MKRAILALTGLLAACSQIEAPPPAAWPAATVGQPQTNLTSQCVADYAPDRDYFPQKTRIERSTQLSVEYHRSYKLVQFDPAVETGETHTFAFVQCGTPRPTDLPRHTVVVEVPVRRIATVNEGMLGAVADIGAVETLVGIPNKKGVTIPAIKAHIARGGVTEMYGYGHSSIEAILALNPDVYLSFYSAYPEFNMHPTLWRLGIKALSFADHLESHPLGRAEWIKFLGLMTNREARANAVYADIVSQYEAVRARAPKGAAPIPVLSGEASARDSWDLFGGENHRTALLRDAGGAFVLSAERTASGHIILPLEKVYAQGHDAPVWLGGVKGVQSYAELEPKNVMYPHLRSVQERRVVGWDRGYMGQWAYPSVDQSMTRPHWVLEDAIRVLHPSALPPGPFHFARPVP